MNVVDTTIPTIAAHSAVTIEATGITTAATYVAPDVTDNYDAPTIAVCVPAPDSAFTL